MAPRSDAECSPPSAAASSRIQIGQRHLPHPEVVLPGSDPVHRRTRIASEAPSFVAFVPFVVSCPGNWRSDEFRRGITQFDLPDQTSDESPPVLALIALAEPENNRHEPRASTTSDAFPPTRWSLVLDAQGDDPAALATFCRSYWFPLYSYARRTGRGVADAEDLTQSFFERILSLDFLGRARRERGRLRSFLLRSFNNFAAEEWRKRGAQKRGAGQTPLAFDALSAEERLALEPPDNVTPEVEYERAWGRELLRQALARVAADYESAGNGDLFRALRDQLTEGSSETSYRGVAATLGLTEASARFAAFKLRQRYRIALQELVEGTVTNPEEVEDEMVHLRLLFQAQP